MFIDEEDFKSRVSSETNLSHQIKRCGSGRSPGSMNRTFQEREVIGADARLVGPSEAAALHGCSVSQAQAYSNGFNSSAQRNPDAELHQRVNKRLSEVRESAIDKILSTMENLTDEKLGKAKAGELGSVASSLSKVMQSSLPSQSQQNQNPNGAVQIVIFAPPQKDEERYETVHVNRIV